MRYLFQAFKVVVGCILIAIIHMAFLYLFPYPLNKINVIFMFLVLAMLWTDSGIIVWVSFLLHFFIELYALTPFGIVLFSGTIAILMLFWLYRNVFINRSFVAVVSLSATAILLYRLLYTLTLSIFAYPIIAQQSFFSLIGVYAWEMLFTVIGAVMLYGITYRFTRRFDVKIIR